jgi:hypothetical protein
MIPSEHKAQLFIYKTLLDQNKFQLLEMSLRHDAMILHLPDAMSGELFDQFDDFVQRVQSTLKACEEVCKAIDKRLTEID